MGLDMYLYRYPRYKNYGARNVKAFCEYRQWQNNERAKEHTFEGWCGYKESDLPAAEDMAFFDGLMQTRYYAWDEEHRWPETSCEENVAYWRKANAVHKWFVERVQDGVDDCEIHREVTRKDLEDLRDICKEIIGSAVLVSGKVKNGFHYENGRWEPVLEDGKLILNASVCAKLLPCEDGFFFGSTEYNEWYLEDVKYTWEVCNQILAETDFDKQMVFYLSSW